MDSLWVNINASTVDENDFSADAGLIELMCMLLYGLSTTGLELSFIYLLTDFRGSNVVLNSILMPLI